MTESEFPVEADAQESAAAFQLQRVYLKDVSLEMPGAPRIFLESGAPELDVQMDMTDEEVGEGMVEVVVRVTVTAQLGGKTLFLVEAKQAGIFELRGIPEPQRSAVLGIVCPGIVYPYLRANVADLITRTGMPPVHLAEINFEVMYHQKEAAKQAGINGGASGLIIPPQSQTRQ